VSDRIHPYTRVVGAIIVPFLVAAFVLLYPLADTTDALFAWTILPPLTAMLLGSAYAGGVVFLVHVVRPNTWRSVRHGFPAVLLFATLLAVATFLHWDRFHFGFLSFNVWVTLYVTTPFLILVAMILNRGEDDRSPSPQEVLLPAWVRILLALIGIGSLVTGLVLFLVPQVGIAVWAWPLTPLTARVCGAILTLPGMVNLWMLGDARWSAFRQIFQAQLLALALMLLALALRGGELLWSRPSAPLFVGGLTVSLVAYAALYGWAEARRRSAQLPRIE